MADQPELPLTATSTKPAAPEALPEGFAWFHTAGGKRVQGRLRCTVDGPRLSMCHVLEHVVRWFSFDSRTRLFIERGVNMKHDGERDMLALIHGRNRWAPFDFCPFCGASVETKYPEELSR